MAMMTDLVRNPATGRHELHFVNQQYDLLMYIKLDEATGKYVLSCSPEEAMEISKSWTQREFDLGYYMKETEQRCKEADASRPKSH
jgi:hypothetical protein